MPTKLKTACRHIGCPALTHERYCPAHKTKDEQRRGSASSRGYTARWRRYRLMYIREHPLCVECQANDNLTPTFAVDHIVPHQGDYDLFWNPENHQSLCERHHNSKSGRGE